MKGRLGYDKWYVYALGLSSFEATRTVDGETEHWYASSHCLQCAKADLLAERGGRVDLRGSHMTMCGAFLRAMQWTVDHEDDDPIPF